MLRINPQYRRQLLALPKDELDAEVRCASKRYNAAKAGYRAGRVSHYDMLTAKADFVLARGIKTQLDKFGAVRAA